MRLDHATAPSLLRRPQNARDIACHVLILRLNGLPLILCEKVDLSGADVAVAHGQYLPRASLQGYESLVVKELMDRGHVKPALRPVIHPHEGVPLPETQNINA